MTLTRREVLIGGLAATATLACTKGSAPIDKPAPIETSKPTPKRILILGGTGFLGPATVAAAIARGHTVTVFNRGKREKLRPLEAKVEHLYGNRDPELPADDERGPDGKLLRPDGSPKGLEQLVGKSWDVVIDNSGYVPRIVGASAKLLAKQAKQYIFISSISAYADNTRDGGDETTPLATIDDPTVEDMGREFQNYGALKVLSERAAQDAFGEHATIVRPGYIVGPGDPTDRFTYWPVRIARGGDVLAPGSPDDPLQWIDVRDLAEFLVTLAERGTGGVFNAVGPATPARWGDVLAACVAAKPGAKLVWVPHDWLAKHDMGEEGAFPIWAAPTGKYAGFHRWSNKRAVAAGATFRPIKDTVEALLAWWPGELDKREKIAKELVAAGKKAPPGDPRELKVKLAGNEGELLAKFRAG